MSMTELSALELPPTLRNWVLSADPAVEIQAQGIRVDLDWWNDSLKARDLPGGLLSGTAAGGDVVDSGTATITRGRLFDLAVGAADDPNQALRLLWHCLAWGSGMKYRLNHKRMDAIAANRSEYARALASAAGLAKASPAEAYRRLYPEGHTYINALGPAFLTKFLYFAGAGKPTHPCLILDSRVAASLVNLGWESLDPSGAWPVETYVRYVELLERWADELSEESGHQVRADLIERCLFDARPVDAPNND